MRTGVKSKSIRRVHKFTVMLTREERAALEKVAHRRGLTSSDIVRLYIREVERTEAAA